MDCSYIFYIDVIWSITGSGPLVVNNIYVICIDMSISPSKNTIKYIYISMYM